MAADHGASLRIVEVSISAALYATRPDHGEEEERHSAARGVEEQVSVGPQKASKK